MFAKSSSETDLERLRDKAAASSDRRRSVLHDGITITGDWESDGIVEFGGTIKGDLTADTIVLTEDGLITGNVRARNVTISGTLEGTIAAVNVTLTPRARVIATIETQSLEIHFGAQVQGDLKAIKG
jgi:cytoskeletal protein CcmA (bactofilin family)